MFNYLDVGGLTFWAVLNMVWLYTPMDLSWKSAGDELDVNGIVVIR